VSAARYNDSGQPRREWLTEAEIKILVTQELKPFHDANLIKFDKLFAALNSLTGSIKTAIWIVGTLIAVVGMIIAVKR
jgi:phage-related minor tail protein